jgi:hypothetical protein
MSDINEGPRTRRQRNAGQSKVRKTELPSSDDDSIDSGFLDEDDSECATKRRTRNNASKKRRNDREARNLRSKTRINYGGMEDSDSYEDHEVPKPNKHEEEKVARRKVIEDSADEEMPC